ncbi:MAG: right-handed parallel beta-helix repeat-containing protein, partial [Bacteroidales bacterium]|nr:right-handed parallel beta-helix repeat-containing protein [Bacteroidales bacterium]
WIEGVHLVTADVYVDGATLTIEAGAIVLFNSGGGLYFGYYGGISGATLVANGTMEKPITFTSAAVTRTPGDWDYIGFYDGASSASSMQYCVVEYAGGYSASYGMLYIDGSSVSIDNSTFRYSAEGGIVLREDGFFQSFSGNELVENASYPIEIHGNHAHTIGSGNTITTVMGVLVNGGRMETAVATWIKLTCAYVVGTDLYIGSETGSSLTLEPGVEVRMGEGTGIYFGYYGGTFGTLTAEGTDGDHIRFTSSAPDISKSAGDWDFIGFYDGAGTNSTMDYCDVEYGGGYSDSYGMISVDGSGVSISNSSVKNSETQGIVLRDDAMFVSFSNNTFEANGIVPIEIYGNYVHTIGSGNTFNTGPGILVQNDRIEQAEATWLVQNVPYIIGGDQYLGVATGANLTISPGTTVKFTEGSAFYVGYYSGTFGVLIADANGDNRIIFTTAAPSGFESAGDWDGIWFYDGTGGGTILDNCLISYGGGYSSSSGNLNMKNETAGVPEIANCQIENSAAYGIYLDNTASPTLTNNILGNNALGDTNL